MDFNPQDDALTGLLGALGLNSPEPDQGITALLSPEANMASVQDRVNWAMQNDPSFKAGLAAQETPAKNPLAADKNGWNLPKTGTVNTTGAEERVNARAKAEGSGVTATRDENGQLVLSNVAATGLTGGGPSMVAATTPNGISGSLELLRKATDADTASGIMINLRQTAAEQNAKLNSEAQNFAASKLGVPGLQSYLTASEANDRAAPEWFPGIGDSPGTAKIRAELNTARSAADIEAKRYLDSNTSAAALRATLLSADQEFQRITRLSDKKEVIKANSDIRAQEKQERLDAETEATMGAMTPEAIARLVILNPSLANSPDPSTATAQMYRDSVKNKPRVAALQATAAQLPLLALDGNPDAIAITAAKEIAANPGLTQDAVEARLNKVRDRANAPGFETEIIKARFGGNVTSDEAKKALGDLRMGRHGMDAAAKQQDRMMRFETALELERKATTMNFANDTGSWGITDDLDFVAAQKKALATTGKRTMGNVLSAYMGDTFGPARLEKLSTFNNIIDAAAAKQGKSLFGMPDPVLLKAKAIKEARSDPSWMSNLGTMGGLWGAEGSVMDANPRSGVIPNLYSTGMGSPS